jgi:hypothetical protein
MVGEVEEDGVLGGRGNHLLRALDTEAVDACHDPPL